MWAGCADIFKEFTLEANPQIWLGAALAYGSFHRKKVLFGSDAGSSLRLSGINLREVSPPCGNATKPHRAHAGRLIDSCASEVLPPSVATPAAHLPPLSVTPRCAAAAVSQIIPPRLLVRHLHRQPSKYLIVPEGAAAAPHHTFVGEIQYLRPQR